MRSYSDPLNNPIGALTSPPILGWSLVRRLPDDADLILGKLMVDAHKRQFPNGGLADQQAVERISMMVGCAQVPKAWFRCIGKTWKALRLSVPDKFSASASRLPIMSWRDAISPIYKLVQD